MQNLSGIAMVFGPFLIILGAWLFTHSKKLHKAWNSFKAIEANFYVMGVVHLLLGLFIISQYNVWMWTPSLFVTILGWFLFIRGFCGLFFPKFLYELMMHSTAALRLWGVIYFIWGIIISKIGFYS